jgi:hypothetical protein
MPIKKNAVCQEQTTPDGEREALVKLRIFDGGEVAFQ